MTIDSTQGAPPVKSDPAENRGDLVERLIAGMATAAAVAVANGKWAHEEHRRAEALEVALTEEITERDRLQELLDQFAYAVAPQAVIGEHTSMNDPWANALQMLLDNGPSPRVETPGQHEEA